MADPSPRSGSPGLACAPQRQAAETAVAILRQGGNAFDAAVAGALVQAVVDPHRCGLGGFGVAQILEGISGATRTISFHARAGSKTRPDQWADDFEEASPDGFGYLVRDKKNDVGGRAIAVPGVARGLGAIHAGRGRLPWKEIFAEGIRLAEEGFAVPEELAAYWRRPGLAGRISTLDRLRRTEAGRRHALKPDGEPYAAGETMRQPALADCLRRLAEAGADDFHVGELADAVVADMDREDALVTRADLATYEALRQPPLQGKYGDLHLSVPPPPAGGLPLLQVLRCIERLRPARFEPGDPEYLDKLAGILSRVQGARPRTIADPAFVDVDPERLLSDGYLDELMRRPLDGEHPAEAAGTTQLCVLDADGNAVSISHSLGYGAGVFSDNLGFQYNNAMSCFDPRPGNPDSLAPEKARYTAITTTIGFRGGRPALVAGAPGGARITAALAQTIVNLIDFGMSPAEAVDRPRIDAYGRTVTFGARVPEETAAELERRGWTVRRSPKPHGHVGRVFLLWATGDGWTGGTDPSEPDAATVSA